MNIEDYEELITPKLEKNPNATVIDSLVGKTVVAIIRS